MATKEFALKLSNWLKGMTEEQADWAEALFAAALDEEGGDQDKALERAKEEFERDPTGEG